MKWTSASVPLLSDRQQLCGATTSLKVDFDTGRRQFLLRDD